MAEPSIPPRVDMEFTTPMALALSTGLLLRSLITANMRGTKAPLVAPGPKVPTPPSPSARAKSQGFFTWAKAKRPRANAVSLIASPLACPTTSPTTL